MIHLGIVGIGDIATKAYLPVLTTFKGVRLSLCSRNEETLENVASQYKIASYTTDYDQFLDMGLDGIFITAATTAHYDLAHKAIMRKIPVHIDKPISLNFEETFALYELAKTNGVIFTVGFNRRFTPMIQKIVTQGVPELVVYQKNRFMYPDEVRRFVVEDFIHVVDTTRYLLKEPIIDVKASGLKTHDGLLKHVIVNFKTAVNHAVCIMNYQNGITEERVEISFDKHQYRIEDYRKIYEVKDNMVIHKKDDDWAPTLQTRGFIAMCNDFIRSIINRAEPLISLEDVLETHIIAEKIVKQIESLD